MVSAPQRFEAICHIRREKNIKITKDQHVRIFSIDSYNSLMHEQLAPYVRGLKNRKLCCLFRHGSSPGMFIFCLSLVLHVAYYIDVIIIVIIMF